MTDKRWQKLGATLVNHSLGVKPGERVMIAMLEIESYPLALAVYSECIKAGGFPQIQFGSEALKHELLRYGNEEQIGWIPEIEAYGMEWADCYIALRGAFNLNECYDVDRDKLVLYQKAMGEISAMRWKKTRWSLVRVPNERFAQQANVSYDKIIDMFFDACTLDWEKEIAAWNKIAKRLDSAGKDLRLLGEGTDLTLSYACDWGVSENKFNVPDGEMYVTPLWNTVNGHIYFEFPATLGGQIIHGLCLTFESGVVTRVEADDNVDFVKSVISCDEGASRLGEFALGLNPYIDICTTDILIDEKIGGTIHIALGRPYDGNYHSSIHWDIVKDTRQNGEILIGGKTVFKNGKFVVEE